MLFPFDKMAGKYGVALNTVSTSAGIQQTDFSAKSIESNK